MSLVELACKHRWHAIYLTDNTCRYTLQQVCQSNYSLPIKLFTANQTICSHLLTHYVYITFCTKHAKRKKSYIWHYNSVTVTNFRGMLQPPFPKTSMKCLYHSAIYWTSKCNQLLYICCFVTSLLIFSYILRGI